MDATKVKENRDINSEEEEEEEGDPLISESAQLLPAALTGSK